MHAGGRGFKSPPVHPFVLACPGQDLRKAARLGGRGSAAPGSVRCPERRALVPQSGTALQHGTRLQHSRAAERSCGAAAPRLFARRAGSAGRDASAGAEGTACAHAAYGNKRRAKRPESGVRRTLVRGPPCRERHVPGAPPPGSQPGRQEDSPARIFRPAPCEGMTWQGLAEDGAPTA